MQRTVKSTVFTFAKVELDENKNAVVTTNTWKTHIGDTKKATKEFYKVNGFVQILDVQTIDEIYKLDDDIFFQYAVKVEA